MPDKRVTTVEEVDAVILETEGKMTVIRKVKGEDSMEAVLQHVKKPPQL